MNAYGNGTAAPLGCVAAPLGCASGRRRLAKWVKNLQKSLKLPCKRIKNFVKNLSVICPAAIDYSFILAYNIKSNKRADKVKIACRPKLTGGTLWVTKPRNGANLCA